VAVADSIVVLRALGLGDLCTGVPVLKALRRAFPAHRLILAAPAWQAALATQLVDEVVGTAALAALPRQLNRAAVAVNLHGRGPQSTRRLLATAPRRLLAFRHEDIESTQRSPRWQAGEHDAQRWCRLLVEGLGVPAAADDLELSVPDVAPAVPAGAVLVHPGASAASRRWPPDRFAAVVRALADRGHRVALTGGASEAPLCRVIAGSAGGDIEVLAGRTTVGQLAATVATAAAVISNDTGVAHLASAYRTASVVLFGPVPPTAWGPPSRPFHRALWTGRAGASGDPHGERLDPRLAAISVDAVLAAFDDVISAARAVRRSVVA
jgi:ADP-heptose:LPS heptosyltransferase